MTFLEFLDKHFNQIGQGLLAVLALGVFLVMFHGWPWSRR
jgi:hypothetical protein